MGEASDLQGIRLRQKLIFKRLYSFWFNISDFTFYFLLWTLDFELPGLPAVIPMGEASDLQGIRRCLMFIF
jgi:hypothetical protein